MGASLYLIWKTGALIKTFLEITPNLLSFQEGGIIGGNLGMGLLLPDQLPNTEFTQLFDWSIEAMVTNAVLQPGLVTSINIELYGQRSQC